MSADAYVLITAACNEEAYIARTIESVARQTVLPKAWVIVSDGSVDNTDSIVETYAHQHRFIRLLRLSGNHPRSFAAQAYAINAGWNSLLDVQFDFIGNLDADVTFNPTYFSDLLSRFNHNAGLGLAGGRIEEDGSSGRYFQIGLTSVPHTAQLFRRQCFEDIGGYQALTFGGSDTCAEVMVRMKGRKVRLFPDLVIAHHRSSSSAEGLLRARVREGRMDYSLGYVPAYEIARCISRIRQDPYLLGAVVRLGSFFASYLRTGRRARLVSEDFIRFFRLEQWNKLASIVRRTNDALSEL